MQLREEIKTTAGYNTHECPTNDWLCKYFENGNCKFKEVYDKCSHKNAVGKNKSLFE